MNEIDIIKSISENLVKRKSVAALSNYEVLCNNINYLNSSFLKSLGQFKILQNNIIELLKDGCKLKTDFSDDSKFLFYYKNIIPRILQNDINVCEKFIEYTAPDNRSGVTVETVSKLKRTFTDYNNLVTSARQYIDSLVSDAYQMVILDGKTLNYHVLVSLNSFSKYATKSIKGGLFNEKIENSLKEFQSLRFKDWTNSHITRCEHNTFASKVDYLFSKLNIVGEDPFKEEIKNLFKFSSEFTHIGYVSTLFTSSDSPEVIFRDDVSPYLPSTENFSELKYQILETCTNFYCKVYLTSINYMLNLVFEKSSCNSLKNSLEEVMKELKNCIRTRNNEYYFFIKKGLTDSMITIELPCMCGTIRYWNTPHDISQLYCKSCGSRFKLMEMEGDGGYVLTSNGPIKVIGSNSPDFNDLPAEQQIDMLKKCQDMMNKA